MSKKIKIFMSTIAIIIISSQVVYAADNNNGNNNFANGGQFGQGPSMNVNHSHGSETIVSEPNNSVTKDYTINQEIQAKAKEGLYVSKLFDSENIQDVNIEIDDDNWNYMLQNANDKPSVLAKSFSIGDEKIENVGIKTKGNLTLSSVWNSDSDRFSFTINTSKYIKKSKYGENQNFYGVTKIALNNVYGDASYMKEYLSYKLMEEMGIPSPACSLVKLSVNGEYWGVYTMVESMDESLIKRTIDSSADGALYKCEAPGGSLLYNSNLDDLYDDKTNTYNFDISTYTDKSNPLSNYSGILENKCYGATIDDHDDDETDEVNNDLNNLFTWMKKLNTLNESSDPNSEEYKNELEKIINVDEVLRYFAVNTYLVNLDSYQSEKMQNYALYLQDGKVTVLPWDYNYSFGGYGTSNSSNMVNFDIDNPVSNVSLEERPLLNVLLQNDEYKKIYESYLKDCAEIASLGGTVDGNTYESSNFSNQISQFENKLDNLVKEDPTAFYTYDRFKSACSTLSSLIDARSNAVNNQVNGDHTVIDTSSINLNEIGDVVGGQIGFGGPDENGPGMPPMGTDTPGFPDGNRPGMPPMGTDTPGFPDGNRPEGMPPMGTDTPGFPDGNRPEGMPPTSGDDENNKQPSNEEDSNLGTSTPEDNKIPATSTEDIQEEENSNTSDMTNILGILGSLSVGSLLIKRIRENK